MLSLDSTVSTVFFLSKMARLIRRDELGARFSEGARQTWIQLRKRGWTRSDLARALNKHSGHVTKIVWGDRVPQQQLAFAIQDLLGVDARLWHVKPKRAFRPQEAS